MTYTVDEFLEGRVTLFGGDNRDVLKDAPDDSIDAILTDGPYALVSIVKRFGSATAAPAKGNAAFTRASKGFMGKTWDTGEVVNDPGFWGECLRVLKPGGHLLSFGGTRTYHRMACAVEDAGFEIRDMIQWLYGSGFPKSHNILEKTKDEYECQLLESVNLAEKKLRRFQVELPEGKTAFAVVSVAILHAAGQEAKTVIGVAVDSLDQTDTLLFVSTETTDSNTISSLNKKLDAVCGRMNKFITLTELKTIIDLKIWNLLQFQSTLESIAILNHTALKPANEPIVLARKPLSEKTVAANVLKWGTGAINIDGCRVGTERIHGTRGAGGQHGKFSPIGAGSYDHEGRFPANVITDGSDEVVAAFPLSKDGIAVQRNGGGQKIGNTIYSGSGGGIKRPDMGYGNPSAAPSSAARFFYQAKANKTDRAGSKHPTVKPIALMRYLARLITPPGGTILDPFAGSGTTGEAAYLEGFNCYLMEREEEYRADIAARFTALAATQPTPDNDNDAPLSVAA